MKNRLPHLCLLTMALIGLLGCRGEPSSAAPSPAPANSGVLVTCPVCGLEFDRSEAVGTAQYQGKTYSFLLADHRDAFLAAPQDYVKATDPLGSANP